MKWGIINYIINPGLTIDIKNGHVNFWGFGIEELPEFIQFNRISGMFYCSNSKLKSLKGMPKFVGSSFEINDNLLESLIGSPEYVKGDFNCYNNKLVSLKGAPEYVGGSFICGKNIKSFSLDDVRKVSEVQGHVNVYTY